jgi:Heterokaryon incompatibility protein (HET)
MSSETEPTHRSVTSNPVEELNSLPIKADFSFPYERLLEGRWIRVLRLLPGKFEDAIACELITTLIEDAPAYEPISYAWGNPNAREIIKCEGHQISITTSLHQALRNFRSITESRFLWADSICIDQADDAEKGHQVSLMADIYTHGERTLIWLGEPSVGVSPEDAMQLVRDFNKYIESSIATITKRAEYTILGYLHRIQAFRDPYSTWETVQDLFTRPWFSRTWVIQEVGLSKTATAFCGPYSINFSEIIQFVETYMLSQQILHELDIYTGRTQAAFQEIWPSFDTVGSWLDEKPLLKELANIYRQYNDHAKAIGMVMVLHAGRYFSASDPRDHVFAFLGHPFLKNIVEPDYTLPLEDVNMQFAKKVLQLSQSLNILCFVQTKTLDMSSLEPSWVPKWHEGLNSGPGYRSYRDVALSEENADQILISIEGTHLRVNGFIFDTIKATTKTIRSEELSTACQTPNSSHVIEDCYQIWLEALEKSSLNENDCKIFAEILNFGAYFDFDSILGDFVEYCRTQCSPGFYQELLNLGPMAQEHANAARFESSISRCAWNRKFVATNKGYCGLAPGAAKLGDVVAVLFGCNMPLILRKTDNASQYKLVEACFINGIMEGEALDDWHSGSLEKEEIVLV